jgi:hypothetical protein
MKCTSEETSIVRNKPKVNRVESQKIRSREERIGLLHDSQTCS